MDYTSDLEQQNEELKKKLAETQLILENIMHDNQRLAKLAERSPEYMMEAAGYRAVSTNTKSDGYKVTQEITFERYIPIDQDKKYSLDICKPSPSI